MVVPRFLIVGTGFLESVSRVFQTFADRSFGGLCAVLNSLAGSLRPMLDCLAGLGGSFVERFASFADGILVLRIRGEG
jgi:hypothetical protein